MLTRKRKRTTLPQEARPTVVTLPQEAPRVTLPLPLGVPLEMPRQIEEDQTNVKQEDGIYDAVLRLANDVYKEMGAGHLESVYHRSMEYALKKEGYFIESEVVIPFFYKNQYVGFGRSDIIINRNRSTPDQQVVLEFKAISSDFKYADVCKLKHYMKHLKIKNGIMINFPQYRTDICKFKFV